MTSIHQEVPVMASEICMMCRPFLRTTGFHPDCMWHGTRAQERNTRPAPAATDTGLETVGNITEECLLELKQMLCGEIHPCNDIGDVTDADIELVTRSQAEELLAANDETIRRQDIALRGALLEVERLKADNAARAARIMELEKERDHWKEYSSGQGKLIESGVFVTNEEYVRLIALETKLAAADNAAKDARIKELDDECNELVANCNEIISQRDTALNTCAQMEEDKDALKAIITKYIEARDEYEAAIKPNGAFGHPKQLKTYDPIVVRYREARAVLGGKPS